MDKLIIQGGKPLTGEVEVSGAKNAALPILAASLLSPGNHTVKRVPSLRDVRTMGRLLSHMGASFVHHEGTARIGSSSITNHVAPYELVKTMRASVLVLGPLVSRFGTARVSLPGGCAIGARPINLHIAGLEKMGAQVALEGGYVIAKAKRLRGTTICFDMPTVTGTENIMMAACLAKGTTIIENAAREPEIGDLARCLTSMGARIRGAGDSVIEIEGVTDLRPIDSYAVIPDRIEAGTFMTIAGITLGDIVLKGCRQEHLDALVMKLTDAGLSITQGRQGLRVRGTRRPLARDIKTMPYPGFPTDMQAQFMAFMAIAQGTSVIKESIFENRYMHVAELRRMGANISIEGSTATVKGRDGLKGAPVMATDLRASASLVVAALCAKGETTIHRIYHLDRGYEKIDDKLRKLGAEIRREKEEP